MEKASAAVLTEIKNIKRRGGYREGAGRPKGAFNKKTIELPNGSRRLPYRRTILLSRVIAP
jgi:hypothetical protein